MPKNAGRGIDQILPHPGDPLIHEPYMRSAKGYVEIAEKANGPIQQPVSFSYIWGDALEELERAAPNLCAPGKGSIASAVARITGKAASA